MEEKAKTRREEKEQSIDKQNEEVSYKYKIIIILRQDF